LLPSGSVLFSTNEQPGLYQLRPPYKAPELIAENTSTITSIEIDQTETIFLTRENGAVGVWDVATMKRLRSFWVYVPSDADRPGLRIEKARNDRGPRMTGLAHLTPTFGIQYCVGRRLFTINDPMPKTGTVLFVSADSLSLVDKIDSHSGLFVSMYLSADGKRLITGGYDSIRSWDIPEFE